MERSVKLAKNSVKSYNLTQRVDYIMYLYLQRVARKQKTGVSKYVRRLIKDDMDKQKGGK